MKINTDKLMAIGDLITMQFPDKKFALIVGTTRSHSYISNANDQKAVDDMVEILEETVETLKTPSATVVRV